MIRYSGVDGVTVARGAIGNPWIFAQAGRWPPACRSPSADASRAARDNRRALPIVRGTLRRRACLPTMRKFGIKYSQLHPQHELVRADFCTVKKPGSWRDVLHKWYAVDGPGVHPPVGGPNPLAAAAP